MVGRQPIFDAKLEVCGYEQLHIAMTRARMAELMAMAEEPRLADPAFTVGLVSALDLLLHAPLSEVVNSLSLSRELEDALLRRAGVLGRVLEDVMAWEVGGQGRRLSPRAVPADVEARYLQALAWATECCEVLVLDP
jgi:EAL and modified HD-GYP domain-containing signal transduction protein